MSERSRSPAERGRSSLQSAGMDLEGSKVLVTGGSRGIGLAAAELLLSLGQDSACPLRFLCNSLFPDTSLEAGTLDTVQELEECPWQQLIYLFSWDQMKPVSFLAVEGLSWDAWGWAMLGGSLVVWAAWRVIRESAKTRS